MIQNRRQFEQKLHSYLYVDRHLDSYISEDSFHDQYISEVFFALIKNNEIMIEDIQHVIGLFFVQINKSHPLHEQIAKNLGSLAKENGIFWELLEQFLESGKGYKQRLQDLIFFVEGYFESTDNSTEVLPLLKRLESVPLPNEYYFSILRRLPNLELDNVTAEFIVSKALQERSLKTYEVLEHFKKYIQKHDLWNQRNVHTEDILEKYALTKLNIDGKDSTLYAQNFFYLEQLKNITSPSRKRYSIRFASEKMAQAKVEDRYRFILYLIQLIRNEDNRAMSNLATDIFQSLITTLNQGHIDEVYDEIKDILLNKKYLHQMSCMKIYGITLCLLSKERLENELNNIVEIIKGSDRVKSFRLLASVRYFLLRVHQSITEKMVQPILCGCFHYDQAVAVYAISLVLELDESLHHFQQWNEIYTKVLLKFLNAQENQWDDSTLSKFLVELMFYLQALKIDKKEVFPHFLKRPVVFFPGSFDPFSIAHKELVSKIRQVGYDLYIAIDEFSWSKSTRANAIRRKIVMLSIADQLDVYLVPEKYSINLGNEEDLHLLETLFPEVSLLVGEDVIFNASAYRKTNDSMIYKFHHFVFVRENSKKLENRLQKMKIMATTIYLENYQEISSTMIRRNILNDENVDHLLDPLAKSYIYDQDLYIDPSPYKEKVVRKNRRIRVEKTKEEEILKILGRQSDQVHAQSVFHQVQLSSLSEDVEDPVLYDLIQEQSTGKILMIDSFSSYDFFSRQSLLNETMARALRKDYSFCIYLTDQKDEHPIFDEMGFLHKDSNQFRLYYVSLNNPCMYIVDIAEVIKAEYRENSYIQSTIEEARSYLKRSIVQMYPGQLLLSIDQEMLYEGLLEKITVKNKVDNQGIDKNGQYLVVPFGEIFKKRILPNTITKSVHMEKYFHHDLSNIQIEGFPGYMKIENQMNMIHSFDKKVLLVDDFLHKGYRLKRMLPLLKDKKIALEGLYVGVLSGRGKGIADRLKVPVDCAYYLPRLNNWFVESKLLPYIGGDSIKPGGKDRWGNIYSINLVRPYAYAKYLSSIEARAHYLFEKTSIKCSIMIHQALNEVYKSTTYQDIGAQDLAKLFITPRIPYRGVLWSVHSDSTILQKLYADLNTLIRTQGAEYE